MMELVPAQTYPLSTAVLPVLGADFASPLIHNASTHFQVESKYGDIPNFVRNCGSEGTLLYLENVEMAPPALGRALLAIKRAGWRLTPNPYR